MKFLEKDLEDIIFNTHNDDLNERGLEIYGKKKRQVHIGNYGIADLITFERGTYVDDKFAKEVGGIINTFTPPIITVYELKKETVTEDTLFQALRYAKGIKRYLQLFKRINEHEFRGLSGQYVEDVDINIVLIGKNISMDSVSYAPDIFSNTSIYTYDYMFDGIHFRNDHSYSLVDEGFKSKLPAYF